MKQHLDLSTPCLETATKGRHRISIMFGDRWSSVATARLTCLAYLGLPLDHKGGSVCHECNNEKCINPLHLYLGSQSTNLMDAVNASTWAGGRRQSVWKCTNSERTVFKVGTSRASAITGVSTSAISKAASSGRKVKGWKFEQRPLRR